MKNSREVKMEIIKKKEKYRFVRDVLNGIRYRILRRREKQIVQTYLTFLTGYSKGHTKTLIGRWKKGLLSFNPSRNRNTFPVQYGSRDIERLIDTDVVHGCLNGKTTKEIMRREFEVFGKEEYACISRISVSHLYNIRNHNRQYGSSAALFFRHTRPVPTAIGVRRKPMPYGKPGYVRVDTVHQGDLGGVKGVYHINIIDEVTQYEMIATVQGIGYSFLKPVLEELLKLFPFKIYEFHSDNGSEYINKIVAKLLTDLLIDQSKSRSRHSNDQALVESKNGSVVRKLYGRNFIDRKYAPLMEAFNRVYVNVYLNYHRPCLFAQDTVDRLGKIRKKYVIVMTPYEKIKSLENAKQYLLDGVTFDTLDIIAYAESDNEFGKKMMKAKEVLFKKINRLSK